jgi:hypothetical protein
VEVLADEIMIRQGLQQWISYVNEFVQQDAKIEIQAESRSEGCCFIIKGGGKQTLPPPECDLTMYGFVAQKIVELHQGQILRIEKTDQGAVVEFCLPQPV